MEHFLKGVGNLANAGAGLTNTVNRGVEGVVDTIEDITIPDAKNFILIPFILFIIANTIIIRLGFKFPFFSYCYKIKETKEPKGTKEPKEKEETEKEECWNTVLYNVMYFIIVLVSAGVCTNIFYMIVFYILNIKIYVAKFLWNSI